MSSKFNNLFQQIISENSNNSMNRRILKTLKFDEYGDLINIEALEKLNLPSLEDMFNFVQKENTGFDSSEATQRDIVYEFLALQHKDIINDPIQAPVKQYVLIEKLTVPTSEGYNFNAQIYRSIDNGNTYAYCGEGKFCKTQEEAESFADENTIQ